MRIFEELLLLERLDYLIRTRATGSPLQLAARLEISERNVYRLLNQLRDMGFPIAYDKQVDAYFYTEKVRIEISIAVGAEKLVSIRGGENKENLFFVLPNFGSTEHELCSAFNPVAFRARGGKGAGGS